MVTICRACAIAKSIIFYALCILKDEISLHESYHSLTSINSNNQFIYITYTHTSLTALFLGLPRWAVTRKVKPVWILLKQETVSGSGISWDICKSAPQSRQITTPAPHCSVFYRPDALPAAQPTASKHWSYLHNLQLAKFYMCKCVVQHQTNS